MQLVAAGIARGANKRRATIAMVVVLWSLEGLHWEREMMRMSGDRRGIMHFIAVLDISAWATCRLFVPIRLPIRYLQKDK